MALWIYKTIFSSPMPFKRFIALLLVSALVLESVPAGAAGSFRVPGAALRPVSSELYGRQALTLHLANFWQRQNPDAIAVEKWIKALRTTLQKADDHARKDNRDDFQRAVHLIRKVQRYLEYWLGLHQVEGPPLPLPTYPQLEILGERVGALLTDMGVLRHTGHLNPEIVLANGVEDDLDKTRKSEIRAQRLLHGTPAERLLGMWTAGVKVASHIAYNGLHRVDKEPPFFDVEEFLIPNARRYISLLLQWDAQPKREEEDERLARRRAPFSGTPLTYREILLWGLLNQLNPALYYKTFDGDLDPEELNASIKSRGGSPGIARQTLTAIFESLTPAERIGLEELLADALALTAEDWTARGVIPPWQAHELGRGGPAGSRLQTVGTGWKVQPSEIIFQQPTLDQMTFPGEGDPAEKRRLMEDHLFELFPGLKAKVAARPSSPNTSILKQIFIPALFLTGAALDWLHPLGGHATQLASVAVWPGLSLGSVIAAGLLGAIAMAALKGPAIDPHFPLRVQSHPLFNGKKDLLDALFHGRFQESDVLSLPPRIPPAKQVRSSRPRTLHQAARIIQPSLKIGYASLHALVQSGALPARVIKKRDSRPERYEISRETLAGLLDLIPLNQAAQLLYVEHRALLTRLKKNPDMAAAWGFREVGMHDFVSRSRIAAMGEHVRRRIPQVQAVRLLKEHGLPVRKVTFRAWTRDPRRWLGNVTARKLFGKRPLVDAYGAMDVSDFARLVAELKSRQKAQGQEWSLTDILEAIRRGSKEDARDLKASGWRLSLAYLRKYLHAKQTPMTLRGIKSFIPAEKARPVVQGQLEEIRKFKAFCVTHLGVSAPQTLAEAKSIVSQFGFGAISRRFRITPQHLRVLVERTEGVAHESFSIVSLARTSAHIVSEPDLRNRFREIGTALGAATPEAAEALGLSLLQRSAQPLRIAAEEIVRTIILGTGFQLDAKEVEKHLGEKRRRRRIQTSLTNFTGYRLLAVSRTVIDQIVSEQKEAIERLRVFHKANYEPNGGLTHIASARALQAKWSLRSILRDTGYSYSMFTNLLRRPVGERPGTLNVSLIGLDATSILVSAVDLQRFPAYHPFLLRRWLEGLQEVIRRNGFQDDPEKIQKHVRVLLQALNRLEDSSIFNTAATEGFKMVWGRFSHIVLPYALGEAKPGPGFLTQESKYVTALLKSLRSQARPSSRISRISA
jgi:hypothetical protein